MVSTQSTSVKSSVKPMEAVIRLMAPVEVKERLGVEARKRGLSSSSLVRMLLMEYFNEQDKKEGK